MFKTKWSWIERGEKQVLLTNTIKEIESKEGRRGFEIDNNIYKSIHYSELCPDFLIEIYIKLSNKTLLLFFCEDEK